MKLQPTCGGALQKTIYRYVFKAVKRSRHTISGNIKTSQYFIKVTAKSQTPANCGKQLMKDTPHTAHFGFLAEAGDVISILNLYQYRINTSMIKLSF